MSVTLLHRELFAITFDEEAARLAGIPVTAVSIYFTLLTALTVALAVRVVGTLLVSALMVIPPAVSLQVARSFKETFVIAILAALISVTCGLYASFIFDLAPGGTIVLIAAGLLVAVMVGKGVIKKWM
jgi:zinc transport system permease protein